MSDDFSAVFEKLDAYFAHEDTLDTMFDSLQPRVRGDKTAGDWVVELDRLEAAVAQAFYEATVDRNPSDIVSYVRAQHVAKMVGYTRKPK